MPNSITEKTLIPLSIVGFISAGGFYLSAANAKINSNLDQIKKNEIGVRACTISTNKNYVEIIQRLVRIEEKLKSRTP